MARKLRINEAGYYHVINRGVQKRNIFIDDEDFEIFLDLILFVNNKFDMEVMSYCLMNNHYHLLVKTNSDNLSLIFQYINTNYSKYFNYKYKKVGTLWQGRFQSFYIFNDNDLFTVSKYIERNPIKANMVRNIEQYKHQSLHAWNNTTKYKDIIKNSIIFDMTLNEYKQYINNEFENDVYDVIYSSPIIIVKNGNMKVLYKRVQTFFNDDINTNRNENIKKAYEYGYTITQIANYLKLSTKTIRTSLNSV